MAIQTLLHLSWADVLHNLGETPTALEILLQATELYKNEHEIEYRIAAYCFILGYKKQASEHLKKAFYLKPSFITFIKRKFPYVWKLKTFQNILSKLF